MQKSQNFKNSEPFKFKLRLKTNTGNAGTVGGEIFLTLKCLK